MSANGVFGWGLGRGLVLLGAAGLGGCAGNGAGAVYQMAIADDAAVVSATTLYAGATLDRQAAESILSGAITAEAALKALDAANQGGDAPAIVSASAAAEAALVALQQQLAALKPAAVPRPGQSVAAYLAILQLAAALTPEIINWINLATGQTGVTEAQVAAEFVTLDTDIHNLQAALAAGK